jgi:hypothetical protein
VGDGLVVYATRAQKCPAIFEVTDQPRWDPNYVDAGNPGEGDQWGVVTPVSLVAATTVDRAPRLDRIGVAPSSIQRKGHTRLEQWQYEEAERLIDSSGSRRRADPSSASRIPIEEGHVEGYEVATAGTVRTAIRRESRLVSDYAAFLRHRGEVVCSNEIKPGAGAPAIYSDLFNETRGQLVEAKADSDRSSIRMAIGQLADYARFIDPRPSRAVLLDARPRTDLVELLESQEIDIVWREGDGFRESAKRPGP